MITRKLVSLLISVLAISSISGIALASWVFLKDNKISNSNKINVNLEASSILGEISVFSVPQYLVLEEGVSDINNLHDGINFYTSVLNQDTNTNELIINDELYITFVADNNIDLNNYSIELFLRITMNGILNNYICLNSSYTNNINEDGYVPFNAFNEGYSYNLNTREYTLDISLKNYVRYISSDKKPNTLEKYKATYEDFLNNGSNASVLMEVLIGLS